VVVFRRSLIEYWGGRCAVTGLDVVEVLRKPWADCESDAERLDVFNQLLLASHLDALSDKGFLKFSTGRRPGV
jgi:putative restriction endonuclease